MIVLGEESENGNILHVIIGPETDGQFNLTGQSVIDVSAYIKKMDMDKPCKLIINRCDSEEEVVGLIAYRESARQARAVMESVQAQLNGESEEGFEKSTPIKKIRKKSTSKSSELRCPKCMAKGVAIVKDGVVHPCKTCQAIDAGLRDTTVPDIPNLDSLTEIRKRIEEEFPDQKDALSRFIEQERIRTDEEDIDIEGTDGPDEQL
jgi:ribosomal protein L37AE/L43A